LSFLELRDRYTIQFRGSEESGNFTVKCKTIPEIVSELKNGNALCDTGIEVAINAQIKGFEKAGQLEINEDMEYSGFFLDDSCTKIIASKVEGTTSVFTDTRQLREALEFIANLAAIGYQNRLDLLAHITLFGIIAPCSFIFKILSAKYLEWPHLHGSPNTTKSKSGEYVLSFDGHQHNQDFNVNMAHVDTTPRFGDTISKNTFPVVVNEVDFTDNRVLRNNVNQPKFRKVLDTSRRAEYVPALSTFFLTGNPPPPYEDAALMKRLATRYHPKNETHFRTEQAAKEFDELLMSEGYKLKALGLFRNNYIMQHQELILDKKLSPFDKAKKIAVAIMKPHKCKSLNGY
jgi:hypothetical protein